MLTLTGQRDIADCSVFRDDVDALVRYFIPQSPRIALDDKQKPIFSLVQYRRDISRLTEEERKTRLGGGILTLSVELSPEQAAIDEIRTTLAADPALVQSLESWNGRGPDYRNWWTNEAQRDPKKLAAALKLNAVPIRDGTVTIAVLGETPVAGQPGEFVANLVGAGRVSMTGRQRAAFMAKLTQDGAVLLWEMVARDLKAIRIGYDLTFSHRLDAVRMDVYCSAWKSYNALHEQWARLNDDAAWTDQRSGNNRRQTFTHDQGSSAGDRIQEVTSAGETARVSIITEAGAEAVKPEMVEELTRAGNDMIKEFLTATFLEAKQGEDVKTAEEPQLKTALAESSGKPYGHHGISHYKLKTWNESMRADLTYTFTNQAVLDGHLAPQDNLSNILKGRSVEEFRAQIDIDSAFYKYLDVAVVCTADFAEDPLDLVKVHLGYRASGPRGPIESSKDMVFQKDSAPQHFATYLAAPDKHDYRYDFEVFYKGSSQSFRSSGSSDESVLVVDVDRLGVLRVDVQLGLVDWERIRSVQVDMSYGSGPDGKTTQFTLDNQRQSQRWVEVIAKPVTEPYTYRLTFIDKNNQRIVLDPVTSRSKQLVVNQPLQDDLEVAIVPAGSFAASGGPLAQVVVAVRYRDTPNNYNVDDIFTLTKEGDTRLWKVPLVNPALRTYEARVTVFYADGVTREDGWVPVDKPILPVGDPFGFRVQILPYLLKNPQGLYQFGTLHLAFDDTAASIHTERDFEISDFTKPLFWRFRLGAPDRHTYSYTLTLFKADGTSVTRGPLSDSKEVLVLTPQ